jgi:hypothetical protein
MSKQTKKQEEIAESYKKLMNGFCQNELFKSAPILPNGKFVQLSAYEEKNSSVISVFNKDLKFIR